MKFSKSLIAAAALAVAGTAQPVFADATLHVFLWDSGADTAMVTGHKFGDGASRANDNMGVTPNITEVPAGRVTFDVQNVSKDEVHEMVVSRLASMDDIPPYDPETLRVDEDSFGSIGEVSELDPGANGQLTVDMKPGIYLLYCNIPGHFADGMWDVITVK